jgi:hypothetical protein
MTTEELKLTQVLQNGKNRDGWITSHKVNTDLFYNNRR